MLNKDTKIGILAPITWSIPPKGYGPYERDVDLEVRGLIAAGYENITLFATKEASYPGVKTVSVLDLPFGEKPVPGAHAWEVMHIANSIDYANKNVDILHSHLNYYPIIMSRFLTVPLVTTLHSDGRDTEDETAVFLQNPELNYISISNAVRSKMPELNFINTVYNGVDFDQFSLGSGGEYLLYAGRIRSEKGIHHAIKLSQLTGIPLVLCGIIQPQCQEYFDKEVQPHVDGKMISFLGNKSPQEVHELMANALAYVALNEWDEPFGNSIAESMASGTPVIATPKGSHNELITDGVTGILVNSPEEATERINDIRLIDRDKCRKKAESLYSVPAITKQHLEAFAKVLN